MLPLHRVEIEKVLPNGSGSYSIAHCDTNGSHAKPADVFIDGMTYNLLNNRVEMLEYCKLLMKFPLGH
jgi:hypothetical protein